MGMLLAKSLASSSCARLKMVSRSSFERLRRGGGEVGVEDDDELMRICRRAGTGSAGAERAREREDAPCGPSEHADSPN